MRRSTTLGLLIGAIGIAVLSGCAQKFTRENYDRIEIDVDDREDVRYMIGEPMSTYGDSDEWYYENEDEHYMARIFFAKSGRVSGKQWGDGTTGEFSGQNPDANPPPAGEVRETRTRTRTIDDD